MIACVTMTTDKCHGAILASELVHRWSLHCNEFVLAMVIINYMPIDTSAQATNHGIPVATCLNRESFAREFDLSGHMSTVVTSVCLNASLLVGANSAY